MTEGMAGKMKWQARFPIKKRQCPRRETPVSLQGNGRSPVEIRQFPYKDTTGNYKRLIYNYIGILVYNSKATIHDHMSLLIEILLKCFKLILSPDATLPPCAPKTCTVADKLNKCGSNGTDANTQTLILNRRVYTYQ